jgi:cytidine deaminase
MSDQSRLGDQNRIRSAGKVRRLTLDDLGIPLLDEEGDLDEQLAEKAEEAAEHTRGDGPLRGAAVASAGGVIYAAPRIDTPMGQSTHALELAVLKALSDGVDQVAAATVYASEGEIAVCGACRQLLAEYGSDGLVVRGVVDGEQVFEASINDLLPDEL